ncbi:MAG: GNAT family N-acetyltransferase, partial [Thermohalobaculum sp.]|nr:GNAT family N-acetyltransferase [Thermohalobaculum sp.]
TRRIVAEVKERTGRELRIGSDAKLAIFPSIAIEATDVALSNPGGLDAGALVSMGEIKVDLALMPLISGDINVERFVLVKPVIALWAGGGGARAVPGHDGAPAGSGAVIEAALARAGVLRIRTLEEMFDAAEILGHRLAPEGDRLAILTNGGGAGVLAADAAGERGQRLATLSRETQAAFAAMRPAPVRQANPADLGDDAGPDRYQAAMAALLADPEVDAVLAMHCPTALASPPGTAAAVIAAVADHRKTRHRPKPVLASWLGEGAAAAARAAFAAADIPSFATPVAAVDAWDHVTRRRHLLDRLTRVPPAMSPERAAPPRWAQARAIIHAAAARGTTRLNEAEAKAVLAAAGIPTVRTLTATGPAEARAAAARLAADGVGRFAVKILSDDILHKSDVGGVILDLDGPEAVEAATRRMLAEVAACAPAARITGVSVQETLRRPDGHELIAGLAEDPQFGPAVLFGTGGIAVEVVNDTALALAPLDLLLARDLIGRTRIARLLAGYRTRPPAEIDAIAEVLIRLGEIACALPMIRELEINPLIADTRGVIALDARILIDPARLGVAAPNPRLAIRPYPVEWEGELALLDGRRVACRPVRPEDAPLYLEAFARMDPEDLRLRFFAAIGTPSLQMIAALTQIDYARDMALIALDRETGELLGVSRLASDPDHTRAEYSVLLRSDLKGKGLGWALMTRLIDYARAEGIAELFGDVLPENRTMLRMCAELGFRIEPRHAEGTVHVVLDLRRTATTTA